MKKQLNRSNLIRRAMALLLTLTMLPLFAACGSSKDAAMDAYYPNASAGNAENEYLHDEEDMQAEELPEDRPTFVENPFIATQEQAVSTFSADVDTASYTYFRKLVNNSYKLDYLKQQGASFRTEEFINYFKYEANYPPRENCLA